MSTPFPDQTNPQYVAVEEGEEGGAFYFQSTTGVLADGSTDTTCINESFSVQIGDSFGYEEANHTVAITSEDGVQVNGWTSTEVDLAGRENDTSEHETYHYDLLA